MDPFVTCIAIAALFLVQLSSAQTRIVFEEGDQVMTENRLTSSVSIPEKLLVQLNSIHSATEFLKKFVESEENVIGEKGGRPLISGRKASPRGRKTNTNNTQVVYADPAKCRPEWQAVATQQPSDSTRLRWPNCIRVKRCGGCCWGSHKACTPLQVTFENVTVIEAYYDHRYPDRFQDTKPVVIPVEHHTKCGCRCVQGHKTCNALQKFDEENCRCVCNNRKLAVRCTQHKVWNDSECTCKCRERLDCSTGRYFNEDKCKCELMIW